MNRRAPELIALLFNEQINDGNLDGFSDLMTEGHTFIDGSGERVVGKERMLEAWSGFFQPYPDYRNVFGRVESRDDLVIMLGYSTCSNEETLEGPAIWTARIEKDLVAEWRVYADTGENRRRLGLERAGGPRSMESDDVTDGKRS